MLHCSCSCDSWSNISPRSISGVCSQLRWSHPRDRGFPFAGSFVAGLFCSSALRGAALSWGYIQQWWTEWRSTKSCVCTPEQGEIASVFFGQMFGIGGFPTPRYRPPCHLEHRNHPRTAEKTGHTIWCSTTMGIASKNILWKFKQNYGLTKKNIQLTDVEKRSQPTWVNYIHIV